jgi:hypothetical protein
VLAGEERREIVAQSLGMRREVAAHASSRKKAHDRDGDGGLGRRPGVAASHLGRLTHDDPDLLATGERRLENPAGNLAVAPVDQRPQPQLVRLPETRQTSGCSVSTRGVQRSPAKSEAKRRWIGSMNAG